ncbi:MAG: hypothetical protein CM15mP79_3050 [Methanobacteriota archaeon]|nr:MAG: hypothetical protein CM15mP79_3050 [Euryarchaeota archaeon]
MASRVEGLQFGEVIGVGFHHVGDGVQHLGPLFDGPCAPRRLCGLGGAHGVFDVEAGRARDGGNHGTVARAHIVQTTPVLGFTPRAADGVEHVDGLGQDQASTS